MAAGAAAWLLLLAAAASGPAEPVGLERAEIKVPGRVVAVRAADVDGDGAREVLVFWRQGLPPDSRGRLSLYALEQQRLDERPRQILSLPERAVAFDVGDADGDGRSDVLLLMDDGVWILAGRDQGWLAERPQRLLEAMTLAAQPQQDRLPPMDLLVDLGDRAGCGLMVPTVPIGRLSLYACGPPARLQRMLRVPFRTRIYTAAENQRPGRDFSSMFQLVLPRFQFIDQNGDGRRDLIFFSNDAVAVFRARDDGGFAAEPQLHRRFAVLSREERIRRGVHLRGAAADFDGDGRADLMFNKSSGGLANMRSEVWVHLARDDGGYRSEPDLRIRSTGYGALARPVDVDGDGRADLVRPHVEMGIMVMSQVLLTGKIDVDFHVHLARAAGLRARPDYSLSSSFAVDFSANQELGGTYPIFGRDFDGDGRPDAVIGRAGAGSAGKPDRLEIRSGRDQGGFDDGACWAVDLHATSAVQPWRPQPAGPWGLLVAFPSVEEHRGDVWVYSHRGSRDTSSKP